jgi:hypothetical protein
MKLKNKVLFASALIGGLALPQVQAQSTIPIGNQALLAGYDFNNNLGTSLASGKQTSRYSDVYGNTSSNTAQTTNGQIYFNGSFGSDSFGTVAVINTEDIDRDILTRTGTGSTFDLGGQEGASVSVNLNNVNVGVTFDEFSINLKMKDAVNSFDRLSLSFYARDTDNTVASAGGITIQWSYSVDGGVTKVSSGLSSVFTTNLFANSLVDFSTITALNGVENIYLTIIFFEFINNVDYFSITNIRTIFLKGNSHN